ncbi:PREDICTED: translation initiation factor IF-2-like [Chinchilla lanigera]|uniref:translation initiation factor IF-2-like n=1 Tax=Chinchilla lanigera TaxID=34839 RepID=UPI0006960C77|nr:PREDICTED: translation initiation factor IF-2-like [Chinchilla lanigera]
MCGTRVSGGHRPGPAAAGRGRAGRAASRPGFGDSSQENQSGPAWAADGARRAGRGIWAAARAGPGIYKQLRRGSSGVNSSGASGEPPHPPPTARPVPRQRRHQRRPPGSPRTRHLPTPLPALQARNQGKGGGSVGQRGPREARAGRGRPGFRVPGPRPVAQPQRERQEAAVGAVGAGLRTRCQPERNSWGSRPGPAGDSQGACPQVPARAAGSGERGLLPWLGGTGRGGPGLSHAV